MYLCETFPEPSRQSSNNGRKLRTLQPIIRREKRICNRIQEFTFQVADLEISDTHFPNLVRVVLSLLPNTHLVHPGRNIPVRNLA